MTAELPHPRDLTDWLARKTVGVVGLQRTGVALARELTRREATVVGFDSQPVSALQAAAELEDLCLELHCGDDSYGRLASCDLVVLSPGVPVGLASLQSARERGIAVLGEVELAFRLTTNEITAITGTKGKTTTVSLLGAMLTAAGVPNRVCGNIGSPAVGELATLGRGESLLLEVSSFQLESTEQFHPRDAAILNLASDHLDRHASFEEYAAAKLRVLRNQTKDDWCYLLRGDRLLGRAAAETPAGVVWISDGAPPADGPAAWLTDESDLCLRLPEWEGVLCGRAGLRLLGRHNALNALFASAMALRRGASIECLRSTLATFEGIAHRLERVGVVEGVTYWNDSMATTPFAAAAGLAAMPGPTIALVGGHAKTDEFGPLIDALAEHARATLCLGESGPLLAELARARGIDAVELVSDLTEAVLTAHAAAQPGDHVLLSPGAASFDLFRDYADRGDQFRRCVQNLRGEVT